MVFTFTEGWFIVYSACVAIVGFSVGMLTRGPPKVKGVYCPFCACQLPFHGPSCKEGGKGGVQTVSK